MHNRNTIVESKFRSLEQIALNSAPTTLLHCSIVCERALEIPRSPTLTTPANHDVSDILPINSRSRGNEGHSTSAADENVLRLHRFRTSFNPSMDRRSSLCQCIQGLQQKKFVRGLKTELSVATVDGNALVFQAHACMHMPVRPNSAGRQAGRLEKGQHVCIQKSYTSCLALHAVYTKTACHMRPGACSRPHAWRSESL